jgi:hypothetical protein
MKWKIPYSMQGDPNWSEDYQYCRMCLKTNHHHVMDGYCRKCLNEMELEKKLEEKERICLRCNKVFKSMGPGNRRCDICLRKDSGGPHQYKMSIKAG